jgi:hypothetical protein
MKAPCTASWALAPNAQCTIVYVYTTVQVLYQIFIYASQELQEEHVCWGEYNNPMSELYSSKKKPKQLRSFELFGSSPKRVQVWKAIYVC